MWQTISCGDTEPHEPHNFTVEVEVICTGMGKDARSIHDPHWITEEQPYRCPGLRRPAHD